MGLPPHLAVSGVLVPQEAVDSKPRSEELTVSFVTNGIGGIPLRQAFQQVPSSNGRTVPLVEGNASSVMFYIHVRPYNTFVSQLSTD
jgi:hypothetical protein